MSHMVNLKGSFINAKMKTKDELVQYILGGLAKPNIFAQAKLAFREQFQKITKHYGDGNGGISEFYVDYLKGNIPTDLNSKLIVLLGQLRDAIRYPMKHLGSKSYGKCTNQIL